MDALFPKLLQISFHAGILVIAVLILRQFLRRAPKWTRLLLWGVVALRLVLPFTIESPVAVIPQVTDGSGRFAELRTTAAPAGTTTAEPIGSAALDTTTAALINTQTAPVHTEFPTAQQTALPTATSAVQPTFAVQITPGPALNSEQPTAGAVIGSISEPEDPNEPGHKRISIASIGGRIWLAGVAAMLLYGFVSYILLRRRIGAALPCENCAKSEGILVSDGIETPFILGIFRPRIYLPSAIAGTPAAAHVIAHEKAHTARKDNLWKLIGFLLLSAHWFNPLLWLAFFLLCRDIELACDERVIGGMSLKERAEYSETLLALSRRANAVYPVAFGETGVKARIKAALNYKKPVLWVMIAAIAACIAALIFLLPTRSTKKAEDGMSAEATPEPTAAQEANEPKLWQYDAEVFAEAELTPTMILTRPELSDFPNDMPADEIYAALADSDFVIAGSPESVSDVRGLDIFYDFYEKTQRGEVAFVKIAYYDPEKHGIILSRIDYDGEGYTVTQRGSGDGRQDSFRYLKTDIEEADLNLPNAPITHTENFYLVDDESVCYWDIAGRYRAEEALDRPIKSYTVLSVSHLKTPDPLEKLDAAVDREALRNLDTEVSIAGYKTAAHRTFAIVGETDPAKLGDGTVTVYCFVGIYWFTVDRGILQLNSAGIPETAITFRANAEGDDFELVEFWKVPDGDDTTAIRMQKYPPEVYRIETELDWGRFPFLPIEQECYQQAIEALRLQLHEDDIGNMFGRLFAAVDEGKTLEEIDSDYSAPDQLCLVPKRLRAFGRYTAIHIMRAFLAGGQTDAHGQLMWELLYSMLRPEEAFAVSGANGQECFDRWYAMILAAREEKGRNYLACNMPLGYLATQVEYEMDYYAYVNGAE